MVLLYIQRNSANINVTGGSNKNCGSFSETAGAITVFDKATLSSPSFVFNTNGPATGNGNAGRVDLGGVKSMVLSSSSTATITANAATAGTGGPNLNGYQAINLSPGANNITLGTGAGKYLLSARGGSQGGNGGYINVFVPRPQIITLDSGIIADNSGQGGTGNGGVVYINAGSLAVSGTSSQINSNGGSNQGNGGDVHLLGNGTISLGSGASALSISATGLGTSNTTSNHAGSIELGYLDVLTANGSGVTLTAGSNAAGGIVNFHDLGKLTVTGTLSVDGKGAGMAGTITLAQTALNTMTLDGSTLSASSDIAGGGNGNTITVTTPGSLSVNGTTFNANGGGTGGDAGSVTVSGVNAAVDLSTAHINANASTTGGNAAHGGTVTISKATGTIQSPGGNFQAINVPNTQVDGGPALGHAPADVDGVISINGVTCQQWKTVALTYPLTYWDCITPTTGASGTSLVSGAASLSQTLQGQLQFLRAPFPADPSVGIYAMHSVDSFLSFFGEPAVNEKDYGISTLSFLRVSGSFQYVDTAGGEVLATTDSGSATIMEAALVHELGHHLDFIWGPPNQLTSSQTAWTSLQAPDFAYMDSQPCNGVFFQATCDANSGKTNSQIFAIQFPEINNADERFAAMFEHVESLLTGNPVSYQVQPELEKALEAFPQQKQYMMNTIASPPPPDN